MKAYADTKHNSHSRIININDRILVRQPKKNKLTPRYNEQTYTKIQPKLLYCYRTKRFYDYSNYRNGHNITRYISFFKRIPNRPVFPETDMHKINLTNTQTYQKV